MNLPFKVNIDRIGTKMLVVNLLILGVMVMIVAGSGINFYRTKLSLAKTNEIYVPRINYANSIKEIVLKQHVTVESYMNHPSLDSKTFYREQDRLFEDAYKRIKALATNSQELELIEQLKQEHDNFTLIANNVFTYNDKNRTNLLKTLLENYSVSVARVVETSDQLAIRYDQQLYQSVQTNQKDLNFALAMMIFLASVTAACALILTFVMTKKITSPLQQMIEVSQEIAQGDLTKRVVLNDKGELGLLGDALNSMVDNLSALINKVVGASGNIVNVSGDFKQHSSDSTLAMNTTDSVLRAVVDSSEAQSRTISSILNSANHVASAIHQIDMVIQEVNTRNQQTSNLAEHGQQSVDQGFRQMNIIRDTMEYLAQTVWQLTNYLSQISNIINLMENFAGQTNMLALNAAIEAARVGEQGKGFAVVANEIRKLADESSKSLEKIREVIIKIEQQSVDTVQTMEDSKVVVESGSQAMQTVSASLKEIINYVNNSVQEFEGLVDASNDISKSSTLIVRDISNLQTLAKQTVDHSNSLGTVVTKQSRAVMEAASSLGDIAVTLEQSTNKFALSEMECEKHEI
jgi:methyl-accepting chemotaxis protein